MLTTKTIVIGILVVLGIASLIGAMVFNQWAVNKRRREEENKDPYWRNRL